MLNILLECLYLIQIVFIIFTSSLFVQYIILVILQEKETTKLEYSDSNTRVGFGRQRAHTIPY